MTSLQPSTEVRSGCAGRASIVCYVVCDVVFCHRLPFLASRRQDRDAASVTVRRTCHQGVQSEERPGGHGGDPGVWMCERVAVKFMNWMESPAF